ncbi:MAG: hypothetical protein AAF800_08395 [Planctomycetota bacterium]
MADDTLTCPGCDKTFRWQAKIAGRAVRCGCGQKFRVPMVPGETPEAVAPRAAKPEAPKPPETNPYELNLPDNDDNGTDAAPPVAAAASGGAVRCPACNIQLRPGAVLCLACGFNLVEGKHVQTVVEAEAAGRFVDDAPDDEDPQARRVAQRTKLQEDLAADTARRHHFQEKTLPLIFLGLGAAVLLINAFVLTPLLGGVYYDLPANLPASVFALVLYFVMFLVQLPCLFVGLLIVSKVFGSAFGELFSAIKKLAALALLAGQFDIAVSIGFELMLGFAAFLAFWVELAISFTVFWVLSKLMFDELEPGETIALWIAMLFLPGFALAGIAALILIIIA